MSDNTSPTQRAGADALLRELAAKIREPVTMSQFSDSHALASSLLCERAMIADELDAITALADYAALQARIAELEARNRVLEADNAILQNNLEAMESCDKELRAYIEEVEARNAASERLMLEMREAALWTEIWGGLLATSVYGHFALTSETSEAVCKQNADRFREAAEKSEATRAAIDAHAQGQAGEEKNG